jgi:hypothetical protein
MRCRTLNSEAGIGDGIVVSHCLRKAYEVDVPSHFPTSNEEVPEIESVITDIQYLETNHLPPFGF